MSDELRVASNHLRLALDRYLNACLAIKNTSAGYPSFAGQSQLERSTKGTVMNEVPLLPEYDIKFRESKAALFQYLNTHSDVVPITRLPVDILVHIFRQLVVEEHESFYLARKGITVNQYPAMFTRVCSTWRQIVRQSPFLWSSITFTSKMSMDKRLAHANFHSTHSKQALMDIHATSWLTVQDSESPGSTSFVDPFFGRIKSLRLRVPLSNSSSDPDPRVGASSMITQCLRASNDALKRLIIDTMAESGHPFIESISRPTSSRSLMIDLPYNQLEDVLSSITTLWLKGYYFNWESRAYCGLTSLKLETTNSHPMSDLQLVKILASSPQLQYLDIRLVITRQTIPPPPIHLPELEALTGDTSLLQLIWPGSKELSVNIISNGNPDILYNARVNDFFTRANTTKIYSDEWFATSGICYLLSLTPSVRTLGLYRTRLSGTLGDINTHPSLETLYICQCQIDQSLLIDMIDRWNIKKLVFWPENRIIRGLSEVIDSEQRIEEELSGIGNTQLEFVYHPRWDEVFLLDFFTDQS